MSKIFMAKFLSLLSRQKIKKKKKKRREKKLTTVI